MLSRQDLYKHQIYAGITAWSIDDLQDFVPIFLPLTQTVGHDGLEQFPGPEFCRKLFLRPAMCTIL